MSKPDTALLDRLVVWMREGGFQRLTYATGKTTITLVLPDGAGTAAARPVQTVVSPGMGTFALRHPMLAKPYAEAGAALAVDDVMALLAVGPVLTAVRAPCDCVVRRVLAEEGAVIGFEDPLFEIEAREG